MAIEWVFFDVGDVLFSEDAQHTYYFHSLLLAMRRNGVDVQWDDYLARIQRRIRLSPMTSVVDAGREFVPDETLWKKIFREGRAEYEEMRKPRPYGMLLDGITNVLADLKRDFRLGIIANQHPPIVQAFADYGIAPYFDVVAIDEIVGVSKPDPAIFRWALEKAGCVPQQAIMIGDRADVDIAPARKLGMPTIRFQRGIFYTNYDPRVPEEFADLVVRETSRLPDAVRRLAALNENK